MAFGVSQTLITNKKCKEKKLMKKILKKTSSVILALCIIFCMGINVQAATHKPGCAAKSTRLVCGSVENTLRGSHYLHTNVYCTTKTYVRTHEIVCSGCGVAIRSNVPSVLELINIARKSSDCVNIDYYI